MSNQAQFSPPLKAITSRQLQVKVNPQGQRVVEGWLASNPKQVMKWEADGSLLTRAQEAGEQAVAALDRAREAGDNHLAPHEIYELHGGPPLTL